MVNIHKSNACPVYYFIIVTDHQFTLVNVIFLMLSSKVCTLHTSSTCQNNYYNVIHWVYMSSTVNIHVGLLCLINSLIPCKIEKKISEVLNALWNIPFLHHSRWQDIWLHFTLFWVIKFLLTISLRFLVNIFLFLVFF